MGHSASDVAPAVISDPGRVRAPVARFETRIAQPVEPLELAAVVGRLGVRPSATESG